MGLNHNIIVVFCCCRSGRGSRARARPRKRCSCARGGTARSRWGGDAGQGCEKEAGQNRWAKWRGHPDAGDAHVVGRVVGRGGKGRGGAGREGRGPVVAPTPTT